jgi:hypothetical protein
MAALSMRGRGGLVRDLNPGPTRRQVLAALLLVPAAVAGLGACSLGAKPQVDPLVALADQARADAALAAAAAAAQPDLAARLEPLRAARTEHAAALDAEVARQDPDAHTPGPAATPGPQVTLGALREALQASGRSAGEVSLEAPAERVGLVASVAACCAAYAAVLA